MAYTILDCYTDEAAGLGVPPYLGTYSRYIAGYLNEEVYYITIDDLRFYRKYNSRIKQPKPSQKTDVYTYNLTKNHNNISKILDENLFRLSLTAHRRNVKSNAMEKMKSGFKLIAKAIQDNSLRIAQATLVTLGEISCLS